VAHAHPGANPNALLPNGAGAFEPLSSQAHMTGIPVTVASMAASTSMAAMTASASASASR
jgi:hypothetical protein